jgi:hypothetical protein
MTREELKQLSDNTFIDNNTGEIEPAEHRNFNNQLIDSLTPSVDLASTTEQWTGELYNGKRVYMLNFKMNQLSPGSHQAIAIPGLLQDYNIDKIWIDYNLSFGYKNNNPYDGRCAAIPSTNLIGADTNDVFGVYVNGMYIQFSATEIVYNINLCFKYTKIS